MGWERRGTRWYYYTAERVGGKVKKIYMGRPGDVSAEMAAALDMDLAARRRERKLNPPLLKDQNQAMFDLLVAEIHWTRADREDPPSLEPATAAVPTGRPEPPATEPTAVKPPNDQAPPVGPKRVPWKWSPENPL